jgi:flavin reductase (DIM6/NTAB) family NADH-FMN oxidoreductase RutF
MTIARQSGRLLKKIVYGDTSIPQEFTVALTQPQNEIIVSLEYAGTSIDVTDRHTTACCAPFILGISVDAEHAGAIFKCEHPLLVFGERAFPHRVLGVIRLASREIISLDRLRLILFTVLGSKNYCLPKIRLWAHYLPQALSNWRNLASFDVKMSYGEIRASQIAFIRPHPLMLGSLNDGAGGNIFPMNLMGELGGGYLAFALKNSRRPAHLVERAGYIAISNVPLALCSTAFRLAANHTKDSVDWDKIPFALERSRELCIPVPASSPRVREMRVDQVHRIGSHTLFIAQILSDDHRSDQPSVHVIHGFYQHWRLKGDKAKLHSSVIEDTLNKRGVPA